MRTGLRVDEIDAALVPTSDADRRAQQRAIARGHLVAHAVEGERAVAASLLARELGAKCPAEHVARRARTAHAGVVEPTRERCRAGLTVHAAVVLLLDPRLRGGVEQLEREHRLALEHGHEPAFDLGPKHLLLGVLLGRLRQGEMLQDPETLEALGGLGGRHRRAVVAQHGARQTALLKRLGQTVDQGPGVFLQIPLQVAAQPRVVVEDPAQLRHAQFPGCGRHFAPARMKIEVPQRVGMTDLV